MTGFENEMEICKCLNCKRVNQTNMLFILMLQDLYGEELKLDSVIKCKIDYNHKKYDIVVSIDGIEKRISIKKGYKNSVNMEGISSFINFLIENGISKESIVEYLKYHYSDGTTNGTGKKRISSKVYKETNQKSIDRINKELNNSKLLLKAVERFILSGNISDVSIDALLYGTKDDFIWIKKEDIKKLILSKKDVYSTAVHFGPLTIQPFDRCLNFNPKYERRRFCVQIKWYNIFDDIIEYKNNELMVKCGYKNSM